MSEAVIKSNKIEELSQAEEEILSKILITGDLSTLSPQQLRAYHAGICERVGIDPFLTPFDHLTLNGKKVLYANKGATEQLRKIHGVSIQVLSEQQIGDLYKVDVRGTDSLGRYDEDTGVVVIKNLSGANLANAIMKCKTKAKRRVTLSLCGLGMLDESETDTIPNAKKVPTKKPKVVAKKEEAVEAEVVEEKSQKLSKGATVATFKQKAFALGLNPVLLKAFAKEKNLTNDEAGIANMEAYILDEGAFKEDVENFLGANNELKENLGRD